MKGIWINCLLSKLFSPHQRFALIMFKTPQEEFWAGAFGDEYATRNMDERIVASNTALFSRILTRTTNVGSAIEFGSNIGLNLMAIKRLIPKVEISAVEINKSACKLMEELGFIRVYCQSILNFDPDYKRDFVFTKGVLIHINPIELDNVYDLLYKISKKYICICEYYSPVPVEIQYRGHKDKLFKRDFAGEMMDRFPNLELIDYGFIYHRDLLFPQDDLSWFLLQKRVEDDTTTNNKLR